MWINPQRLRDESREVKISVAQTKIDVEYPECHWNRFREREKFNLLKIKLHPSVAQTQRITNDRDRAQTHRSSRNHRIQQESECRIQHPSRDRNPNRIVEEGKKQILPDISHRLL